ncbi:hypothetical protein KFL_014210020 [Klebsormidium nitens]|uniref:Uncharacterized protein n=1 Tax=Klebsormidium nitens TaxID=105231 RepID=A0A1Y1IV79_KLENI|nr:hypothetical protein KFL_014210020 [Klebsormidium nitens]|eukprot:GAQ93291.1 hypothetical protein KFL_014210020 [Klebsormidium nitens]
MRSLGGGSGRPDLHSRPENIPAGFGSVARPQGREGFEQGPGVVTKQSFGLLRLEIPTSSWQDGQLPAASAGLATEMPKHAHRRPRLGKSPFSPTGLDAYFSSFQTAPQPWETRDLRPNLVHPPTILSSP